MMVLMILLVSVVIMFNVDVDAGGIGDVDDNPGGGRLE